MGRGPRALPLLHPADLLFGLPDGGINKPRCFCQGSQGRCDRLYYNAWRAPAGQIQPNDCEDCYPLCLAQPGTPEGAGVGAKYTYHSTLRTWHDARDDCRARGGDLAKLRTPLENFPAWAVVPDGVEGAWIGLNDEATEGTWLWADGTAPFTNWALNRGASGSPTTMPLVRIAWRMVRTKWGRQDANRGGEWNDLLALPTPRSALRLRGAAAAAAAEPRRHREHVGRRAGGLPDRARPELHRRPPRAHRRLHEWGRCNRAQFGQSRLATLLTRKSKRGRRKNKQGRTTARRRALRSASVPSGSSTVTGLLLTGSPGPP